MPLGLIALWLILAPVAAQDGGSGYAGSVRVSIATRSGEAHFDYLFRDLTASSLADGVTVLGAERPRIEQRASFTIETVERGNRKRLLQWRVERSSTSLGPIKLEIDREGALAGELPPIPLRIWCESGFLATSAANFHATSTSEGVCLFGPLRFGGAAADEARLAVASFGSLGGVATRRALPGETAAPRLLGRGSARIQGELKNGNESRPALFLIEWSFAAQEEAEATLEANVAIDQLEPGAKIPLRVRIGAGQAARVQAVEFSLEDVSCWPGVTTNALNHARFTASCRDCGGACLAGTTLVEGGGVARPRLYRALRPCPLDDYLDLFFSAADNAGARVTARLADAPALTHPAGDTIEVLGDGGELYEVKLRCADGAARGRVRARVRIDDLWHDAACSTEDGSMAVPLLGPELAGDVTRAVASDQSEDRDDAPEGSVRGDGLSVFEEQRGFLVAGGFVRTDPEIKDLFVLDVTGSFEHELDAAARVFATAGLRVHRLLDGGLCSEVVNANSPSWMRAGDQPAVVLLGPTARREEQRSGFAYVGPPTAAHHVLVVERVAARTLVHQLAHQVGVPHHGEGMATLAADGVPSVVAVTGGETSGDVHCLMRIAHADLLCVGGRVLDPFDTHRDFYRTFPPQPESGGAEEELQFCTSPEGTGMNAQSQGAGSATYGSCSRRFVVKGNAP